MAHPKAKNGATSPSNESEKHMTSNVGTLEHLNITVTNPEATAATLCDIFGWHIRWSGPSLLGGRTIHVGSETSYLAVYTTDDAPTKEPIFKGRLGNLNHVGVVVDDLDETERRVIAAGFTPHTHGDYEPGRRFYFDDHDDVEYEVVSYS